MAKKKIEFIQKIIFYKIYNSLKFYLRIKCENHFLNNPFLFEDTKNNFIFTLFLF